MDFAFDARTEQLRAELLDFMVSHVHSAEPVFAEQRLLGRRAAGPRRQLVESNVPTALNTPARSGRLEAIPLVGDYGSGLGQRRSGSSQLRRRASI